MDIAEHHDILIIGAGLSGINSAHVVREKLPHRKVTILEGRSVIGGTWSFFSYPGFRSDSYMTTFGFKWHPWPHEHKIASAAEIACYLEDAARKDGILDKIRFYHKVTCCEWRDEDQSWTLTVDIKGTKKIFAANFLLVCTGYYSYEKALEAMIPGIDSFKGTIVHPQWWPQDLDYTNKRVIVIGSGATAVTLLPAMANKVSNITLVQRSPSYVVSRPTKSALDRILRLVFPARWAAWLSWWKDTIFEIIITQLLICFPNSGRRSLTNMIKQAIPKDMDASVHFNPRYKPLQQRICVCPDGDFFKALHRDNVQIVTDVIKTATSDGILMESGEQIQADIIITATGLFVELLDGMKPVVNGQAVDPGSCYTWRGGMLESLPNMGYFVGYVLQTWTPGADVMAKMIVRVIQSMEAKGATKVVPVLTRYKGMRRRIAIDANSSYFVKAANRIPKVTGQDPWCGRTNWIRDICNLWFGNMDKDLVYSGAVKRE